MHYAVVWENEAGFERSYIFTVAEDGQFVSNQVAHFRVTMTSWLSAIGLLLVLIQLVLLRWGLKPLRQIGQDIERVEAGEKNNLDGNYPTELKGVVGNLNALINSERAHLERYRNTLADLAHSLKTPLAILRGCIEAPEVNRDIVQNQISRMHDIVEYQLQKAAAKGKKKVTGKVSISFVLQKIITSLEKVYAEKHVDFDFSEDQDCQIYCEQGDLFEIAGNLLDNAAKWCQHKVRISVIKLQDKESVEYSLLLLIEDDGAGIAPEKIDEILKRGVRADENIEGHGIGMAVVNELIALLGGRLIGAKSTDLGGMQWQVYLP